MSLGSIETGNSIGSSQANLTLKTAGKIKIQIGRKFIDLIKDGKINADSEFIFNGPVGSKDGIYVSGNSVYLKVGNNTINLLGEVGTTYVSFLAEQETTPEQKYQALQNIGFVYPNLAEASSDAPVNGIIYAEQEQKFYIVKDGILTEFSMSISNPYNKQFVIAKSDSSTEYGALIIQGQGVNNSLMFDTLKIYSQSDKSYIDSSDSLFFKVNEATLIECRNNKIISSVPLLSSVFQSEVSTADSGFKLYIEKDTSFLEVDNITVRNQFDASVAPTYWYGNNNIIKSIEILDSITKETDETTNETTIVYPDIHCKLTLNYKNNYKINDLLYVYAIFPQDGGYYFKQIPLIVCEEYTPPETDEPIQDEENNDVNKDEIIEGEVMEEESTTTEKDDPDDPDDDLPEYDTTSVLYIYIPKDIVKEYNIDTKTLTKLKGQVLFLIGSDSKQTILRRSSKNLDLIEASNFEEEADVKSVQSRFGDLTELDLKLSDDTSIKGSGIFSKQGYFKEAGYTSDYKLPIDDNSSRFASTEWVNQNGGVPKGAIIMWHGSEIPEGWALCDGTNGTPNLVDKFIKAAGTFDEIGTEGGNKEILLESNNIPKLDIKYDTEREEIERPPGVDPAYLEPSLLKATRFVNTYEQGIAFYSTTTSQNGFKDLTSSNDSVWVGNENPLPIKIEPQYYSLMFIMKII